MERAQHHRRALATILVGEHGKTGLFCLGCTLDYSSKGMCNFHRPSPVSWCLQDENTATEEQLLLLATSSQNTDGLMGGEVELELAMMAERL